MNNNTLPINPKIAFDKALKKLPNCCADDPFHTKTVEDCYFLALLEKDLFEEGEVDTCCTRAQYKQVCKYLEWLKK
jgi:hypothetical protein